MSIPGKPKDCRLIQIECVLATAKTGSIDGAVRHLKSHGFDEITRSTVSKANKTFERFLGVPIFDRTGNSIKLNAVGEPFREKLSAAHTAFKDAVHRLRASTGNAVRVLQLGYAPTPTFEFLERTAELFEEDAAPSRVHQNDKSTDECKQAVIAGRLHAALVPKPLVLPKSVRFEPLVEYPVRCFVGRNNSLSRQGAVEIKKLRNERFVAFKFPQYRSYLRRFLSFRPDISAEYEDVEELLGAVRRNHGVALLLPTVCKITKNIYAVRLSPEPPLTSVGVLYRDPLLPEVQKLISCARRALSEIAVSAATPCGGKVLCLETKELSEKLSEKVW